MAKNFDSYLREISQTGGDYSRAAVSLHSLKELSEDYEKVKPLNSSEFYHRALGIYNNLQQQMKNSRVSNDANFRGALSELEKMPLVQKVIEKLSRGEEPKHLRDAKAIKGGPVGLVARGA